MATQSSNMLHPVPTRTLPAQTRPTAALPTAHPLRALPGNEPAHGLKLAAADASEPERRHEDNKDDEAAWLPSGNEAAAATDTVSGAGAETAGASSVTGGASTTGAAAEATAGASSAPAGSSLFASLTANPELTVGAILGTVTLGAAMTGKSPYDGSAESAPAPSPLASGAGQQHGSAADSPATGNRGIEETGSGTSAGSASNTASGSGTAASTGTGADVGAAAGSSSGAGAASGSHASSDAGHVGAASTEGSAANAGGSGAPGGAAGGAATSPGTGHGTDPAHTQSLNYGTDENKAIGAAIFNGADSQDTPEFIRITSIRGKNAGTVNGLMTLENGQEITVGQVISRADFERIFWNASKSDGSFSFVPVKDAQGTAIPNTVEQTVIIRTPESTKPGSQGSGSDTGNPATGTPGTGESTQTGGTPTGGESDGNGDTSVTPTNPPSSEPASPPAHQAANAPAPILPDYAPNQSVQQAIHANDKPVGASIFNGTNPEHAPSFVKITAIQDKDGADVTGVMTLGKGGTAITTDQVISREQFDNVFLDALKAPGGSFKFVPVMGSEGTAMPGASEQTVSIGVDYLHHFPSQPFVDASKADDESKTDAEFSYYRVYELTENEDTNGTLDGLVKISGNERTPLQKGDLIKPEDFDNLYWDYTSNNGGRFLLVGVDAQGTDISNEKGENLYMSSYATTRDGQEPPEVESTEDGEDEGEAGTSAHSAPLHLESFLESASAFHGSSHLSVNGQSTLDSLLEHQVIHGIL